MAKARRRGSVTRRNKPQSLLVLHLDSNRLRADGLHLGDISKIGRAFAAAGGGDVAELNITSGGQMTAQLDALVAQGRSFDVVVAIGHSDESAIQVAPNVVARWDQFAASLKKLKPRRLVLVACLAGRWLPAQQLFSKLPLLRRIYGCPVPANKAVGALMLLLLPYLVKNRRPNAGHVMSGQAAAVLLAGSQIREWLRTKDKDNPGARILDPLADFLHPHIKQVPGILGDLFSS